MRDSDSIVLCQSIIRGYLIRKFLLIPSSYYQTKNWRQNQSWYINGKRNECEKYQINKINKIVNGKLLKTYDRIHTKTHQIMNLRTTINLIDSFHITENFDGKIIINNKIFYFNLKFVCDNGGAQIRTLKLSYLFIEEQINYLLNTQSHLCLNKYFINILDGDTSNKYINKFIYLLNKKEFVRINKFIFIGDLHHFQKWWNCFLK